MIMDIIMFVDRISELKALKERLDSDRFELIVLYGRRRVGKTRLVLESIKGREHLYFLASETGNIGNFKREMSEKIPGIENIIDDWGAIFERIDDKTIVLDEFPNMITEDPSILSQIQKIVDAKLQDSKNKLILLGSSISMMTDRVLSYKGPLYGRRTSSMELEPMKFYFLKEFFPKTGWKDICRIFGLTDGIPYYIEKVKPPFWEWLEDELKRPDSLMRHEVDFVLKYEFTDSRTYRRILEAIANGNHTPAEIRNYTGLKHSDITPYLRNLMDIKMVKREIPITEKEHSRKGRYHISDNLVTFWFRFILPNRSAIQEGIFSVESIKDDFNTYMGTVFKRIAMEMMIELNKRSDELPFRFERMGGWWHKGEEIDIVCLNKEEKKAMLFEVKWKDLKRKDVERIIANLERKAASLGLEGYKLYYGIVARRSRYKQGLIFDIDDIRL